MSVAERFLRRPGRPVVMGGNGAVSAGHPLASLAGLEILKQGGNAFDAAVTVAAALGVVEPHASGLGGDAFILLYDAQAGRVYAINATGPAPESASIERFPDGFPSRGPLAASVPGAFSGLAVMLDRWGTLDLRILLSPAISMAEDGFPISHLLADRLRALRPLLEQFPASKEIFVQESRDPDAGDVLVQSNLAETMRVLAARGHDAFYRGPIAEEMVRSVRAEGGILDLASFEGYQAEIVEPLSIDYCGYQVYVPPPNSSAHVLLQELVMFAEFDAVSFEPLSPDLIHLMVEIKKRAFADRERFNSDPRYGASLPDFLLSPQYARERISQFDPLRASAEIAPGGDGAEDTTYFCVTDQAGNAVSITTSINAGFGCGFVAGRTGIMLNNRMTYWHLDPEHPNVLAPGKRVRHTISPAMVLRDGKPAVVIGTPGSDGQVQTIFQVLVHLLHYGLNPQTAVEIPRWRSFAKMHESNFPHGLVDELVVDFRFPDETQASLRAREHQVVATNNLGTFGSCQLIQCTHSPRVYAAAADPRRDAYALAW